MHKLRDYQREGLRYLLRNQYGALYWDMRLGKTTVAIRRAKLKKNLRRALVVAPFSAMQGWEDDLVREGQGVPLRAVGPREKRMQLLRLPAVWNLINWEAYRVIPEIARMPWDIVICDESHYLKNPQSQVSNFYTENFREAEIRINLSGTPAPESDLEFYQQLRFLDHSILGYKNFYEYRAANFTQGSTYNQHEWCITPQGRAYLNGRLAKHCSFLKRRDLNLGAIKIYNKRLVEFDAATRAMYRKCEEEFVLSWRDTETETIWATQKHIWLRRICGGLLPREDGSAEPIWMGKAADMATVLTHELRREPVIIWCRFVDEVKFLSQYLAKHAGRKVVHVYGDVSPTKREQARRDFQKGIADTFIGQPECFKLGTDLSRADVMFFYSSPEGAATRQQVEERFITVEKTGSVLIVDWAVNDSVEEDLLTSLILKESRADATRRAVKRMQRGKHYAP